MKRFFTFYFLFFIFLALPAQIPAGYYSDADGEMGRDLKTALFDIIGPHTNVGYDGLWTVYQESDVRPDGKIWDMYSNCTNYTFSDKNKSYKKEGDSVNREHSIPQSWFNEGSPMKSDAFHVYPTDGYVNNRRSNYPFGEVAYPTYQSNEGFCKLGPCVTSGYSGIVFEPADEYKGDFARTYFYMATCYEDRINSWDGVFGEGRYPGITQWALDMFLRWAADDPVSKKEIDRNNAIYKYQKNRNPYIDYPGLEQYVWGSYKQQAFSASNYVQPTGTPTPGPDPKPDPDPDPDPKPKPQSEGEYVLLTATSSLAEGAPLLIVCGEKNMAMSASSGDIRTPVSVTIQNKDGQQIIDYGQQTAAKPSAVILGREGSHYTLYDPVEEGYLALTSSKNKLNLLETAESTDAQWNITITSGGSATIQNVSRSSYTIQYNSGSPRFCCYSSGQTAVQIYQGKIPEAEGVNRQRTTDNGQQTALNSQLSPLTSQLYDLQGRSVRHPRSGIYIQNRRLHLR